MSERGMSQETIRWPQYLAGLAAAGGAFAIGAALGWSSPAQPRLVDQGQYFPISNDEFGWVASIVTLGCAISCLPVGFLMRKFGRKWTMMSLVVPFTVGWILVIWATSFVMLFIGRLLIGLAGGAFCVSAPQYSAEIAEQEIRGTIGSFFQVMITSGVLFVYCIGPYLRVFTTNIICGLLPLIFGACFFFMPESPVYLVIENREEEAKKSYRWLRGENYDPQPEIDELKHQIFESSQKDVSLKEEFGKKSSIKAIIISIGLMFFQQAAGINVVIFYATIIFNAANTGIDPDVSTIITGLVHVLATMTGANLVDRAGRKMLLLISTSVMTLALAALGVFFFIQERDSEGAMSISWLPIASLCTYIIFFAIGFGPIPWLMASEVLSKEISVVIGPAAGCVNWILAFIITLTFSPITQAIGIGETFWIFAAVCLGGIFFVFFYVIETKGKSLAEIQRILAGEKAVVGEEDEK